MTRVRQLVWAVAVVGLAHGASRVIFNPADASEGAACILGKGFDSLNATCDIAVVSGASVQGNADAIDQLNGKIDALKQFVCEKHLAGTDHVYSVTSNKLVDGYCPVACASGATWDATQKLCVSPYLENPTDVGSSVQDFCSSGCQLSCPAGAKGPGWHLPGGSDDASAELRWDGVELNRNYFTVSMWLNRDDADTDIGLFSYGELSEHQGFMAQMRSSDFHIRAASTSKPNFDSFDSSDNVLTASQTVGTWSQVAIAKDLDSIRFYLNGALVSTNNDWAGKPNSMPTNRHFNVGSWFESSKILKGYVSNIQVLSSDTDATKALSNADVQSLYNSEISQSC